MEHFFYLHGWASSPSSGKAQFFRDRFQNHNLTLQIPDLNQGDFFHLTMTRQIQQVQAQIQQASPPGPVTLVGSSLGGLTALWVAQSQPQVQRLILLAPAVNFLANCYTLLGESQHQAWQTQGQLQVYHYGEQRELPLSYEFWADMTQYDDTRLIREVPTLILHGQHDTVIPWSSVQDFVATRPWIKFLTLDSDHLLANVQEEMWQAVQAFCQL